MKNFALTFACMAFIIVIGGAVYEHVTMVPKWAAAPPLSLSMFNGKYGLNSGPFWIPVHPVTLILLIAALVVNRKTPRQKNILIVLGMYVAILVITFIFFVPELMDIIKTPYSTTIDPDLQARAALWENLSLVRLGVMFVMAYLLLTSLAKPTVKA
jgi:hypothetical protein